MKSKHRKSAAGPIIDSFRRQHLVLAKEQIINDLDRIDVVINETESPLAWLARRRGRDGRPLIEAHQFQAGERLRAEFTRANLMPRTTSNWGNHVPNGRGNRSGGGVAVFTEAMITARQRVNHALEAVGPELAGLLLDVCCFLKGLEDVERERSWPPRSAKVVLQLALDRLSRHYGYAPKAQGRMAIGMRAWHMDGNATKAGAVEQP